MGNSKWALLHVSFVIDIRKSVLIFYENKYVTPFILVVFVAMMGVNINV